jgi:hypothetical protein
MRFSFFFTQNKSQLRNGPDHLVAQMPNAPERSGSPPANPGPSGTIPEQPGPFRTKIEIPQRTWLLTAQAKWITYRLTHEALKPKTLPPNPAANTFRTVSNRK